MQAEQQVRHGPAIGVQADPRLQQRCRALERQRDQAHLGKRQAEFGLKHRVDRWQHGLHQVIEQVGKSDGTEDLHHGLGLRRGGTGGRAPGGRSGGNGGIHDFTF